MNILHIISSPRGNDSFSLKLGNEIISEIKKNHSSVSVVNKNVATEVLPHFGQADFWGAASEQAIAELKAADILVIGVPMYNFAIPSTLKTWIDNITKAGVTFKYNENGQPVGLVTGKKAYLAIATGGIYSEGEAKQIDYTENYLRTILGFIGITDVTAVRVEGVAISALAPTAFDKALKVMEEIEF